VPSFTFSAQRSKRCLTLRDAYVQGVLLWNVWEQLDAARRLIAELGLFRPAELRGRGRATADGRLLREHLLDELFLTLAPQVTGRDDSVERLAWLPGSSLRLAVESIDR
jgi:hypothetical protein